MAVLKNKNLKLDLDYVRSQFPAFNDKLAKNWSFFENAGGSYVPQNVIDKLTEIYNLKSEEIIYQTSLNANDVFNFNK